MERGDARQSADEGESRSAPAPGRVEQAIALAAPLLDLLLAVGERVSRTAEPVDYEHYPVRKRNGSAEVGDREDRGTVPGARPDDDRR